MLGMLMGSRRVPPTKRPVKEGGSAAASVVNVKLKDEVSVSQAEVAPAQVAAPSIERIEPKPVVAPAEEGYESSTYEHLYSAAPQPTTDSHADHDWTEVATQGLTLGPPPASLSSNDETSTGPKGDDVVDEMSSASSESFHQEAVSLKYEPTVSSDELPAEIRELRTLRRDMVDLENELKRVLRELDAAEQLNQDLKEENRSGLDTILKSNGELQAVRQEREEAKNRLRGTGEELETVIQLNQNLNDENITLRGDIQGLDQAIRGLEREKWELIEACDGIKALLDTALQRNRTLEDEKRGHEVVIEGLRVTVGALQKDKERGIQQLDDEKQRWVVENQGLEEVLRTLESDKREVLQQLEEARSRNREDESIKAQLAVALQRDNVLEEENRRLGDEIKGLGDSLRDNLAAVQRVEDDNKRQKEELRGRLHVLTEERDEVTRKLEEGVRGNQELEERSKRLWDQLRIALAHNDELQKQNHLQSGALQAREKQVRDLENNLEEMTKIQNQRQAEATERRIRMLEDQVRRQASELRTIKNQTRSGSIYRAGLIRESQSGVIGLVDTLNTEIFQASAFMADSLYYGGQGSTTGQHVKEAIERASKTMGEPMVLVLRWRLAQDEIEFDPLPIQIALQACIVSCCMKIMASWYPGHWEYADFLATIYSRIQGSGTSNHLEQFMLTIIHSWSKYLFALADVDPSAAQGLFGHPI
jgi:chromosome segregation ATPase